VRYESLIVECLNDAVRVVALAEVSMLSGCPRTINSIDQHSAKATHNKNRTMESLLTDVVNVGLLCVFREEKVQTSTCRMKNSKKGHEAIGSMLLR
jgi:hypothetical protein